MATKIPTLPPVERLSPRVIRILGDNPSKFTLQGSFRAATTVFLSNSDKGTNTYLVGQGSKRTLLDTGEGKPKWIETLKQVLADENASLENVVISHWHPDHVGGIKDVQSLSPLPKIYKNLSHPAEDDSVLDIADGQKFSVEGATLRAFHTPGHTTDHMAFVLEEEDALFTVSQPLQESFSWSGLYHLPMISAITYSGTAQPSLRIYLPI